jgi:hypothetical protein
MKRLSHLIAVTMALGNAVEAQAQAPMRALTAPDATFRQPFSAVTAGSVRELADGRVVVIDARDRVVQLVDFASGSAMSIGRDGSGPGEYRQPMRLFATAGDTTLLVDRGNGRLLVIAPDGKPVSTFRIEPMLAPGASGGNGRYFYAQGQAVLFGSTGPVVADSVPVMRFDRARSVLDTVAWVRPPKLKMERSRNGGITTGEANPLNAADTWMALPDGSVAVVRVADYHVDFFHPNGRVTRGAPIAYAPVRVTSADKDAEEARRREARQNLGAGRSLSTGAPGAPASGTPPPNNTPLPPLTDWPEVKPPFRWVEAVHARPNGELWLQRTEVAGARGTLFDVINSQGVVTHRVRVAEGWTLVGFGNGTVYTTTRDQDDLVYLQRHRVP